MKILLTAFCLFIFAIGLECAAQADLSKARELYAQDQFEEALNLADAILNENSEDFDALFIKANCHQKLESYGQAITTYKAASRIKSSDCMLHTNWGAAIMNSGDLKRGEKKLEETIACDPSNAQAHYFLGNLYYYGFRSRSAAKAYEQAIALEPNHRDANYMLAATNAELGKFELALSGFEKVHEIDPELEEVALNMAIIYIENDRFEEGKELLEKVNPRNLKNKEMYFYYLAETQYFGEKDPEAACETYKKAADLGDTEAKDIYFRHCLNKEEREAERKKRTIRMSF